MTNRVTIDVHDKARDIDMFPCFHAMALNIDGVPSAFLMHVVKLPDDVHLAIVSEAAARIILHYSLYFNLNTLTYFVRVDG